jgi:hypothetical protein
MPQYQAGQVRLESGVLYSSTMQPVPRVSNVRIDYNVPRANVGVLNRGKPLEGRPVINYTPVDASVEFYKSDSSIEQMLGLVNGTSVVSNITETKAANATYGIRSMQVAFAPTSSTNYNGLYDLKSGVLTSYTLQGGVGDPVRGSFGLQFLDCSGSINTTTRDSSNTAANLVKPENVSLTGIQFTGYGLTGVTIQSFSFSLGFGRASVQQLGTKFPTERPLTDVNASFQCQGWFEGINNSVTGLSQYDCGAPSVGVVGLTMQPSCGGGSPSTITMRNPYIDSFSIDSQVGGFSTVAISLSLPIGPNPNETSDGSVVIFN